MVQNGLNWVEKSGLGLFFFRLSMCNSLGFFVVW